MASPEPSVPVAFELQGAAFARLGSAQYAALARELKADYERGGLTFELLAGHGARPLRDALLLR